MRDDNARYYRQRGEVEADLAQKAQEPGAVASHRQLAKLYFERAQTGNEIKTVGSE